MTREEKLEIIQLIRELNVLYREISMITISVKRYENYIARGLVANDSVSFDNDLSQLKETLEFKKNKIRNQIVPALRACLNS